MSRTENVLNRQCARRSIPGASCPFSGGKACRSAAARTICRRRALGLPHSHTGPFRNAYAKNASLISLYFPLGMGISVRLDMVTAR